ncbi:MAG TPA: hypothetical protein PKA63_01505 [Oligoflexia bacterium]|nr:hypothetical protein [Oligoflexia bacterium]
MRRYFAGTTLIAVLLLLINLYKFNSNNQTEISDSFKKHSSTTNTNPESRIASTENLTKSDHLHFNKNSIRPSSETDLRVLKLASSEQYFFEKRRRNALKNGEALPIYHSKEDRIAKSRVQVAEHLRKILSNNSQ